MSTIYTIEQQTAATVSAPTDATIIYQAASGAAKKANLNLIAPYTGRYRFATLQGNLGTLSSLGTSTTVSANQTYYADIFIPVAGMTLTGIGWLNGTTATTDRAIVSLYSSTGTLLANSTLASNGTLIATSNVFQQAAFTSSYQILNPGRFWIGYQQSGTTATPRTIATATWVDVLTGSAAGALGVATASITPPTTFTADTGPIAYVY